MKVGYARRRGKARAFRWAKSEATEGEHAEAIVVRQGGKGRGPFRGQGKEEGRAEERKNSVSGGGKAG